MSKRDKIFSIAFVGILVAIEIVLSRFCSIATWNMKISFAFIPAVIAARRFGPWHSMAVAGISDFLGAMLFPIGPYFPGFTFTAALCGFVTGVLIHKECSFMRITASVLFKHVIGTLVLNTLWICILNGKGFIALLGVRVFQAVVMTVVEIVIMEIMLTKGDSLIRAKMHS